LALQYFSQGRCSDFCHIIRGYWRCDIYYPWPTECEGQVRSKEHLCRKESMYCAMESPARGGPDVPGEVKDDHWSQDMDGLVDWID
jgi:hypothetical protein